MYLRKIKHYIKFTTIALLSCAGVLFSSEALIAAQLQSRTLSLSDSGSGLTNVTYTVGLTRPNTGTIGSFELEICSNDPFPGFPCDVPIGLDFSGGNITAQTGIIDFTIHANSTANKLIFSRAPSIVANGNMSLTVSNVTNPSTPGSYFVRLQTFASDDASGPAIDAGGLAYAINPRYDISTEVPPFLYFCVAKDIPGLSCALATGDFVNLGELSASNANTGYSQMLVATNAGQGFIVSVAGTTLTSGNNVISSMASTDSSRPGNNQFGINLRDNSNPNIGQDPAGAGTSWPTASYNTPNIFKFVSGDTLVSSNTTSNYRKFTVSYLANRGANQSPGIYNTYILYIALANF